MSSSGPTAVCAAPGPTAPQEALDPQLQTHSSVLSSWTPSYEQHPDPRTHSSVCCSWTPSPTSHPGTALKMLQQLQSHQPPELTAPISSCCSPTRPPVGPTVTAKWVWSSLNTRGPSPTAAPPAPQRHPQPHSDTPSPTLRSQLCPHLLLPPHHRPHRGAGGAEPPWGSRHGQQRSIGAGREQRRPHRAAQGRRTGPGPTAAGAASRTSAGTTTHSDTRTPRSQPEPGLGLQASVTHNQNLGTGTLQNQGGGSRTPSLEPGPGQWDRSSGTLRTGTCLPQNQGSRPPSEPGLQASLRTRAPGLPRPQPGAEHRDHGSGTLGTRSRTGAQAPWLRTGTAAPASLPPSFPPC